jgi:hypothetical protein
MRFAALIDAFTVSAQVAETVSPIASFPSVAAAAGAMPCQTLRHIPESVPMGSLLTAAGSSIELLVGAAS